MWLWQERNYFQLERDKINTFWEITKKELEDRKAELRNKDREMEELEERHQVEIKVYKQKVKHLLYEHQNNVSQLKEEQVCGRKARGRPTTCARLSRARRHPPGTLLVPTVSPPARVLTSPPRATAAAAAAIAATAARSVQERALKLQLEEHRLRESESKKDKRSLKLELKELGTCAL